ncbi:hypothetical protein CWE09_13690 [Aliidiomarina minuta]|uniref:Secreted protein containing HslJ-like protein n=1 Tax=Aliidiomarina minuta TaxID=880057 RepID=A0A432W177_9GAMM|nr:META domain-containing protein [Aliidiomarina minuta]RUO22980.1 hypothetical protein CWE09_13690 [Aliidiomarina minuta]
MKGLKSALGLVITAGLVACSSEPESQPTQLYHCGAASIEVTQLDEQQIKLRYADTEYELESVEAASGSAYSSDDEESMATMFWSQGNTAMVEIEGRSLPMCAKPGAIIESFTASGNEPFWHLSLAQDELRLQRLGEEEVVIEVSPELTEQHTHLHSDESNLHVEIHQELCIDSMSGMNFPQRVSMRYQGEELEGCGGLPARLLQGVEWQVQQLKGDDISAHEVTLQFMADGNIAGHSGCNHYFGRYDISGEGMQIRGLGGTKMACEQEVMNIEYEFLDELAKAVHFNMQAHDGEETGGLVIESRQGTIKAVR